MAIEVGIDTELLKYEIKKTYARVAPRLPAKPLNKSGGWHPLHR